MSLYQKSDSQTRIEQAVDTAVAAARLAALREAAEAIRALETEYGGNTGGGIRLALAAVERLMEKQT